MDNENLEETTVNLSNVATTIPNIDSTISNSETITLNSNGTNEAIIAPVSADSA